MHSTDANKGKPDVIYTEELIRSVPALQQIYRAHLQENDELLPHVFFGEVTRFVVTEARKAAAHDSSIARLLHEFEKGLEEGPEEVRELISVSFVENLCGEREAVKVLKPLMREKLKSKLATICGE
jgi:hypothetical protein